MSAHKAPSSSLPTPGRALVSTAAPETVRPRFGELATICAKAGIKPVTPQNPDGLFACRSAFQRSSFPVAIEFRGTVTEADLLAAIERYGRPEHLVPDGYDDKGRLILKWVP